MLNISVLVGFLGQEPITNFTKDGKQVTSFNIAFNPEKDKTCWIKIVTFGKLAEVADKYISKGDKVAVCGKLDESRWQGKDGAPRSTWQIIANSLEFIKVSGIKEGEEVPF